MKAIRPSKILEPFTQWSIVTFLTTRTNDYTAVNIVKVSDLLHFNTTELYVDKSLNVSENDLGFSESQTQPRDRNISGKLKKCRNVFSCYIGFSKKSNL
jgi:hypothetical protein